MEQGEREEEEKKERDRERERERESERDQRWHFYILHKLCGDQGQTNSVIVVTHCHQWENHCCFFHVAHNYFRHDQHKLFMCYHAKKDETIITLFQQKLLFPYKNN